MSDGDDHGDPSTQAGHPINDSLDQHSQLDSTATARYASHAMDTEPHQGYSQMDNDEHDHNHDTFFDGSAMIHAAFAAQAIELAERERQEADHYEPQAGSIQGVDEEVLGYGTYSYGRDGQADAVVTGSLPLRQEDSYRTSKKRKLTSGRAKKTKSKGKATDEHTGGSLIFTGDATLGLDVWPMEDSDQAQLEASPHGIASKRQSPADIATKKRLHITAEQKRRAAIKSGYEALYRVIPALRDADLKEGKGRGGSGPGGGGSRTIRNDEHNGQTSAQTTESRTASSRRGGQSKGSSLSPGGIGDGNDDGKANRSYPHHQQYDDQGRPIRPGVRSIFPLVRQPGSEVTDGRQGPRSESVVLQQSEHSLTLSEMRRYSSRRIYSCPVSAPRTSGPIGSDAALAWSTSICKADTSP
jgi:hypothetical protein